MYVDPIFQARMPDPYYRQLNYGTNGVLPEAAGWNVNSAYLTPTFMAGYRPNYSGPQNMEMPYMGFWRGLNTALPTPAQPDTPYYMDPRQYRENALSSSTNKAMDIAMTAAQLGVGIGLSSWIGNLAGRNITGSHATMGQMFRGENALGRLGVGVGRAGGALAGSLTAGAGRLVGTISPWGGAQIAQGAAALGRGLLTAGGAVGGAIGGLAVPFAVGVGAAEMADRAFFRPYLAGRQASDVLRTQYEGQAVGLGTSHSPLGISNANAARIGSSVSSAFGGRLDFNDMSAPQFMQFGMQEGLYKGLKNVNASSVTARTKELAEQVKMVMAVFNEPSMQDAIKQLGQLMNTGGVSGTGGVASLLGKYKLTSAMTGISTRELAGTIGAQGQMMYGQAGLVPVLGQAAGMAAMQGIDAAFRSGLVGNDVMAMLGGRQGMAQGTQQGFLGLSQSTYNKVMAYNQYALGGARGDITGNLNKMGAFIAADPLSAYGKFALNANKAVSAQLQDNPFAPIQGTMQLLDNLPGAKNSQGQYKAEVLYSALLAQGLDPQSAESMLRTIQGYGAPGFSDKLKEAGRGIQISNREKFLEENGLLYYNSGLGKAYYNVRRGFADVSQYMGESWGGFSANLGGLTDAASGALFGIGGATDATGLYNVNTEGSYEDFMTKKTSGKAIASKRKITMGGGGKVNYGSLALGAAGWAGGAVLSGTGIGAVIGVPLMAAGGGLMASGAYGYNPEAAERIGGLYAAADKDSKLRGILDKANAGTTLTSSEQMYLMSQAGETTEAGLNNLLSDLDAANVSEAGAGKEVNQTEFEKAQDNFKRLLREDLSKNTSELTGDFVKSRDMTGKALMGAGTRTKATALSDTLGMEGSASLGKILYEINRGSFDGEGNFVGPGKGVVATGDQVQKMLGIVLAKNPTWAEKLRKAGINPSSAEGQAQLLAIGKSALAQNGAAVAAADIDPSNPDFARRLKSNLSKFKQAGMGEFTSSGASNLDVSQLSANFEQNVGQVESAIASNKQVGLAGNIDFSAMITTISKSADLQLEAAKLQYAAAMDKDLKDVDAEINSRLATPGRR